MENQYKITEKVLEAYEKVDDYGKEILEGIFGKDAFCTDIKDKVKTFMDAVEILGKNNKSVKDYYDVANISNAKSIIAFTKLRIIAEALNEGWQPQFDMFEGGYYTSFDLITEYEFERLEEEKKKESMIVCLPNEKVIYALVNSKLSISCENREISFKSRELAQYCGIQFMDIWEAYIFG